MLERAGSVERRRWSSPLLGVSSGLVGGKETLMEAKFEKRKMEILRGKIYIIIIRQSLEAPYRLIPLVHDGSSLYELQVPFAIGSVLSCKIVFHFSSLKGVAFCFNDGLVCNTI